MFQNSYVVAIIVFILLVIIFYLFEIGYTTSIEYTGEEDCLEKGSCTSTKIVKHFSWKYPLAIALMVWLIWHFCLFPPQEIREMNIKPAGSAPAKPESQNVVVLPSSEGNRQKINMINWN